MFGELFHKITFGIFRKKDVPVATQALAQPQQVKPQQVKPQELDSVGDSAENPVINPAAPAAVARNATQNLQSSTPGVVEDSIQRGGGRRRRRGSRGSRGSRSKSKRGGFEQGSVGHGAMGFGRAGGGGHRRSKKRNTHKRRK